MSTDPKSPLDPMKLKLLKETTPPSSVSESKRAQLEEERLYDEARRSKEVKDNLNKMFVVFIWIAFIAFIVVFFIRVAHVVLPNEMGWLSENQISDIDSIIVTGGIGGFIGRYFKRLAE